MPTVIKRRPREAVAFILPDGRRIIVRNIGTLATRLDIDAPLDIKIERDDVTTDEHGRRRVKATGDRVGAPNPLNTAPSLAVTEGASTRPPAATGFGAAGGEGGR